MRTSTLRKGGRELLSADRGITAGIPTRRNLHITVARRWNTINVRATPFDRTMDPSPDYLCNHARLLRRTHWRAVSRQVLFLANHILDLQSRLRYRCDVIDSLRVNVDSIVRAVTLICVDLMQDTSHQGVSSIARQITRGRVREAILRCRRRAASRPADFDFVSMLLDAEAQLWTERHAAKDADSRWQHRCWSAQLCQRTHDTLFDAAADPAASSRALSVSEHTPDHLAEWQGGQARMQAQSQAQHANDARDTNMPTSLPTQD